MAYVLKIDDETVTEYINLLFFILKIIYNLSINTKMEIIWHKVESNFQSKIVFFLYLIRDTRINFSDTKRSSFS